MNYEEMLDARDGVATHREKHPLGTFYKKLIGKKYRNVVELRPELTDSVVFCEALKANAAASHSLGLPQQLRFGLNEDSSGLYEIEIEGGSYQTFQQLLVQNPAVVAGKDYIDRVVGALAVMLKQLHQQHIFQLCLAPQFIFARKTDNMPMLLCHGSFFMGMSDYGVLYEDVTPYVAPEVLDTKTYDERSDVYALGKFIERLYDDSDGIAFDYREVVKTATDADPDRRYPTIDAMLAAVAKRRNLRRSALLMAGAVAVALFCLFIYLDFMPQPVDVEFVKPVVETQRDPYESGMTLAELGLDQSDSLALSEEDRAEENALEAEVERIFRKQFTRAAESTLSKIYSKDYMSANAQTFITGSSTLMDELLSKRDALIRQSGMEPAKANEIADEIISTIRLQKQKEMREKEKQAKE